MTVFFSECSLTDVKSIISEYTDKFDVIDSTRISVSDTSEVICQIVNAFKKHKGVVRMFRYERGDI